LLNKISARKSLIIDMKVLFLYHFVTGDRSYNYCDRSYITILRDKNTSQHEKNPLKQYEEQDFIRKKLDFEFDGI